MNVHEAAVLAKHGHSQGNTEVGGGQETQADPVRCTRQEAGGYLVVALVSETHREHGVERGGCDDVCHGTAVQHITQKTVAQMKIGCFSCQASTYTVQCSSASFATRFLRSAAMLRARQLPPPPITRRHNAQRTCSGSSRTREREQRRP